MLIQKLVEYAQHTGLAEADPYFESKDIRWLVVIDPAGAFVQLLRLGDEKRGLEYAVPKKVGGTAGGVATFGTDWPRFVLGYAEDQENVRKAERDFPAFTKLMNRAAEENPGVADFQAAKAFYADRKQTEAAWLAAADQKVKDADRLALSVTTSHNIPIFDTEAGRAFWRAYRHAQERAKPARGAVACLCCGRLLPPVLTSGSSITGPLQGGKTGAMKVASFNQRAFTSYGWEDNMNAAMCTACDFAFSQSLNHLLRDDNTPRTRIDQGGIAFGLWADAGSAVDCVEFFEDPNSAEAAGSAGYATLRRRSPWQHQPRRRRRLVRDLACCRLHIVGRVVHRLERDACGRPVGSRNAYRTRWEPVAEAIHREPLPGHGS